MMGQQEPQKDLFNYAVNLDKRVRTNHPLRQIQRAIDFGFVRERVASHYGFNGNESVPPEVILKMMFLLFYDDVSSERDLMRIIPERLDYLWFLGYGLDDEIPDHSVLSKARRRWGPEVFEELFVRVVEQCVKGGLVAGRKIHMDGSLIEANASKKSVIKGTPELIQALKKVYEDQLNKLDDKERGHLGDPHYEPVNDRMVSATDPDSAVVGKQGDSRPRYKQHRVVDDAKGVITALETTSGDVMENRKLMGMIEQHEQNTGIYLRRSRCDMLSMPIASGVHEGQGNGPNDQTA